MSVESESSEVKSHVALSQIDTNELNMFSKVKRKFISWEFIGQETIAKGSSHELYKDTLNTGDTLIKKYMLALEEVHLILYKEVTFLYNGSFFNPIHTSITKINLRSYQNGHKKEE